MKQLTQTDYIRFDILALLKQVRNKRKQLVKIGEEIQYKLNKIRELKKEVKK